METQFAQMLVLMLSFCSIVKGKLSLFTVVPKCSFEYLHCNERVMHAEFVFVFLFLTTRC